MTGIQGAWRTVVMLMFVINFDGQVVIGSNVRGKVPNSSRKRSEIFFTPREPQNAGNDVKAQTWIWPLPLEWSKGENSLLLDSKLVLVVEGSALNSKIIEEAFERYTAHIFVHRSHEEAVGNILRRKAGGPTLQKLVVKVLSADETLQLGTDESYSLRVPAPGFTSEAYLEAKNVYGALRGLETFSQLCRFNFEKREVEIIETPWTIKDEPRFKFRGLMIDTSRHYLPVETIEKIIDSMSYAKLNVLHWHIVDSESFPLEIPSYPGLWKGSYTSAERYTINDARYIVEYARRRGINVMPEMDTPGHAVSWGLGYPQLWPSPVCQEPLDVSSNFTFDVIAGIFADFKKVFPFDLLHLGGDEVDTTCWQQTPHIREWLSTNKMSAHDAYASFVMKAQKLALSLDRTPVNWEEPFTQFGELLDPRTVVHEWYSNDLVPQIVNRNLRCIVSNQDVWYLDHLDVPWELVYLNEPLPNPTSSKEQELVLGGEVCMWGETADTSDIEATIWPRAAAAAERLWSPANLANSTTAALPRLHRFRCLLNERGVGAAPVANFYARSEPYMAGSCYYQ